MSNKYKIRLILSPYNSLEKTSLYVIGIFIFIFFLIFSILCLYIGAWPISVFMGIEYLLLCFLLFIFYQKRKIREDIEISYNKINYKFYKNKKLYTHLVFSSYWSKIRFWKKDNESQLILLESNKRLEIAKFMHSKPKENIYKKINDFLRETKG